MQSKKICDLDVEPAKRLGIEMNDSRFYEKGVGVASVDRDRWLASQEREAWTWFEHCPHLTDDRSQDHAVILDNYKDLPHDLGDILEVGCGPFTQVKTIACGHELRSITLLDPLINRYLEHPNCTYKDGRMQGFPVGTINLPVEAITFYQRFDTVICINTIEHVINANEAIDKMLGALRPDGLLIFGDKTYDGFHPDDVFDLTHPIHVTSKFFNKQFKSLKKVFLDENDAHYYLIGRKHSR